MAMENAPTGLRTVFLNQILGQLDPARLAEAFNRLGRNISSGSAAVDGTMVSIMAESASVLQVALQLDGREPRESAIVGIACATRLPLQGGVLISPVLVNSRRGVPGCECGLIRDTVEHITLVWDGVRHVDVWVSQPAQLERLRPLGFGLGQGIPVRRILRPPAESG